MPKVLGTSTFSVPFFIRLLPDSTAELHFLQSVFCWWCTCRSVSSCLSQPCSISTPDKLCPPWFSLCLPRQCICVLFWLPVSASTLHMFLFCLSSFSEESHVQSGGLLLCLLIFLHVGKPCFCALRREFRKMTGCCGLLCSFLGQSAYHSLSKPQLYWCESRVFSLLLFFLFCFKISHYHFMITASKAAVGCHIYKRFFLIHENQILYKPVQCQHQNLLPVHARTSLAISHPAMLPFQ